MKIDLKQRISETLIKSHSRPYPAHELLSLLSESLEEIKNLERTLGYTTDLANQALDTIKKVAGEDCSSRLRLEGKSYPRTCKTCGIGPCKFS